MKELVPYFCLEWNWGTNSCVGGTVQPLLISKFHSQGTKITMLKKPNGLAHTGTGVLSAETSTVDLG